MDMSFELTFLGASGGPIELNTCGLLVKPANVSYRDILEINPNPLLVIDGGSGASALAHIIRDPHVCERHLLLYPDAWKVHEYLAVEPSFPFLAIGSENALATLLKILCGVQSVLLTHPHLDHILALVINLAGLPTCQRQRPFKVFGSQFCVDALRHHVFNGVVWPDLVLAQVLALEAVQFEQNFQVNDGYYTITMMELSHGHIATAEELLAAGKGAGKRHRDSTDPPLPSLAQQYTSLAFLVHENATQAKLLVFGDFESDLVLGTGRNRRVWLRVAPFVADGTLKGIVLECSSPTVAPGTDLYGHLMPLHLIGELQTLHECCALETHGTPLQGLNVVVTHVKELAVRDPRQQVLTELRELNEKSGLGLRISVAVSGVLIVL